MYYRCKENAKINTNMRCIEIYIKDVYKYQQLD